MSDESVKVLALILAANARIEGMKAENMQRHALGHSMAYTDADFFQESAHLECLSLRITT